MDEQPPSPAHSEPAAAPPPALAAQLQALPPLPAPPDMWRRVRERTAQRRVQRRRRTTFALAAGLAAALVVAALVGVPDAAPPTAIAPKVASLPAQPQGLAANGYALPQLPAAAGAELLVRARIGGIDAALNRRLLQGDVHSRPALLRRRAALMESLTHIERHRQQAIVQAVY